MIITKMASFTIYGRHISTSVLVRLYSIEGTLDQSEITEAYDLEIWIWSMDMRSTWQQISRSSFTI